MYKYILGILLLIGTASAGTIHVAIAANINDAMKSLKQVFHAHYPNTKVILSLGSSGKMAAQINHGAPYQIFMSADMAYPQTLYDGGIAVTKPLVYAEGSLVLFSRNKQDYTKGIQIIENSDIQSIVIANPKTAPYGKASVQALKNAKLYSKIVSKLVYGESIGQTISYTVHVADIGFVAKSSLFSPNMKQFKEGKHWMELSSNLYTPIDQGIVILKNGQGNKEVESFYHFIFSTEAKKILESFGYKIP
ncbi:MAG: molybdate ABC transporter substrate-binding protein [Sulfurovum sp.]|nr:molybdate ABC transporter substrate-binding protein [Sulfurovum sp.]